MNDLEYKEIYTKMENNNDKEKDYEVIEGTLYKIKDGKKIRIIRESELDGIMYMMHDHPTSAHFGINATYEKIRERYYWKNMRKDIENYVKTCNQCQKRGKPRGDNELHPIKVKEPFYQIGIDFVGPLPRTRRGNNGKIRD